MTATTGIAYASLSMLVLGLGLGMVMQVLVIAVQNAVDYQDLGVATSGATLFRLIGGSLGTAVLGAIFASRLAVTLARLLPSGVGMPGGRPGAALSPSTLALLPPAVREAYATAFSASLSTVFIVAAAIALGGFVLAWLLPERPLRETVSAAATESGRSAAGAFAMPTGADTAAQIMRALGLIANRDVRRQYIARVVERAGVQLTPAAWLLVRIERDPTLDPTGLARAAGVSAEVMRDALTELQRRGLVADLARSDGVVTRALTQAGGDVLTRLSAARRDRLVELFAEWPPEQQEALAALLGRLANELVPNPNPATIGGGTTSAG